MSTDAELALSSRSGLPDALRVLADAYPRTDWDTHANFGDMVQFWMKRHAMFRQLSDLLQTEAQSLADREVSFDAYAPRLSHFGGLLINELHAHHHIEDAHYFPKLIGLEPRISRGFDLLESDHAEIDEKLHKMATGANAVLGGAEILPFMDAFSGFSNLLERHLTDEEDMVVPVSLHTAFNG